MPNGGSDCCVGCGFNSANKGQWWQETEGWRTRSSCIIRDGIPLSNPAYTYCRNYATRSTEATGPIYASGLHSTPDYERIPWNGAYEPSVNVPAVCVICGRAVEEGVTVAVDRQTTIGACSHDHYIEWWMSVHPGEELLPRDGMAWGQEHGYDHGPWGSVAKDDDQ
jgi:hypothetical protein